MTINALCKILQAQIAKGNGRCPVCIDKPTFTHSLESDGVVILDIHGANETSVMILNEDGGVGHGKHDTERYRYSLVLFGALGEKTGALTNE
jgi:hypothetical protein